MYLIPTHWYAAELAGSSDTLTSSCSLALMTQQVQHENSIHIAALVVMHSCLDSLLGQ